MRFSPKYADSLAFAKAVTTNRGATQQIFSNEKDADSWLLTEKILLVIQ